MIEGATFDTVPNAGHFVQEEAGDEVIEILPDAPGWLVSECPVGRAIFRVVR